MLNRPYRQRWDLANHSYSFVHNLILCQECFAAVTAGASVEQSVCSSCWNWNNVPTFAENYLGIGTV